MRAAALVAGLLSLAGAVNGLSFANLERLEELRDVPKDWHQVGSPDADQKLRFMIAVKQPANEAIFEQALLDISTPSHPNYGKHMKRDELKTLLRPRADVTEAILDWLQSSGIKEENIEDDGEWINFDATVSQAENMMDTKFNTYRSQIRKNVQKVRTLRYSVPAEIKEHIKMIQPTTRFAQIRPERSQVLDKQVLSEAEAIDVASCNSTITPTCLRDLYNIKGFTPKSNGSSFMAVNGFLEEYARYDDLEQFQKKYAPWAAGQSFDFGSINGSQFPQETSDDSVEANLDIQYTVPLVAPLDVTYYYTSGRGPLVPDLDQPNESSNEPYLEFFTELLKKPDSELPHTLTTSYGEDEQSVPRPYAESVCSLIGQLGARGVSVLFSSGDTGPGSACQTNDGKNTTRFLPIFPAACPYVTSVGGTFHIEPEEAVDFSSGGFSDIWPRPEWQDAAVSKYLDILGDRWDGLYNPEGRGFPDVAAQGYHFRVVDKGRETLVGGTSASSPAFASIVALLNAARIEKGLPVLGWLNPWLYSGSAAKGLTDIVDGGSTGCTGLDIYSGLEAPYVPYAGWNATEGWDPVTGLGTPKFDVLLEEVLKTRYRYYQA